MLDCVMGIKRDWRRNRRVTKEDRKQKILFLHTLSHTFHMFFVCFLQMKNWVLRD